ncbi:MarR family winged helix-turn-helix transcriptional regulator [Rummeliibacillus pycnus]|uniref:MarR family winged helix-turn-helix transcriptional regulator n=1 Tax=Rummeliibacillus pycnus TaxID=101070 RepID=UPI003D2B8717
MNIIFHEIFQTTRKFTNSLNDVLKDYGLYNSQWTILYTVYRHKTMTLTEIWKYLNVEAPTVTRTVSRLEQLGWLVRQEGEDRRSRIITLSEQGLEKYPAVEAAVMQFENSLAKDLSTEEQQMFLSLLQKLKG